MNDRTTALPNGSWSRRTAPGIGWSRRARSAGRRQKFELHRRQILIGATSAAVAAPLPVAAALPDKEALFKQPQPMAPDDIIEWW
jgi:hypothetical protein